MEEILAKPGLKSSWTPTQGSFKNFLVWLDNGEDSDGRSYLEMRGRLVAYFDRKQCTAPDDLADETLNRVSRRLEEEGSIYSDTPAHFCYITARFVFLEQLRSRCEMQVPLDDASRDLNGRVPVRAADADEREQKEKMLECLDECISKLDKPNREMILGYYFGKEREKIEKRRSIAARLGISINALAIRACRIRNKLEACVGSCANGP